MVNCQSRVASTFIVNLNNAIVIRFNLTDEAYFSDFKAPSVSESDFGSLWLVWTISNLAMGDHQCLYIDILLVT